MFCASCSSSSEPLRTAGVLDEKDGASHQNEAAPANSVVMQWPKAECPPMVD